MIRHALAEGWLILRSRGLISPVLALALAIPISLAGVTLGVREWLAPVIELGDRESVVTVLLHPRLNDAERLAWISDQGRTHSLWQVAAVEPGELAGRMASWFPYLEEVLERGGPEMLPAMVEIRTRDPQSVLVLKDDDAVLAVGPTSSVNRVVGRVARQFALMLISVAVALIAAAVLLAAVWVHLELHRHSEEIAIMRLMGATESTVKGPFLVAATAPAVIAAVVSVVFSVISVGWIVRLAEPLGLQVSGVPMVILMAQIAVAVVLPLATALLTLERYAKAEE